MKKEIKNDPIQKFNYKKLALILAGIIVVIIFMILIRGNEDNWESDGQGGWIKHGNPSSPPPDGINDFVTCAKKYPVLESYPAECKTPDGRSFAQVLSEKEKQDLVLPTY